MSTLIVTDRDGTTREIAGSDGSSVMEIVRDAGFPIEAICGGSCSCATCHCYIDPEWLARLPAPDADESELVQCLDHYDPERSRLTCQIRFDAAVHDGLTLTLAPEE